ncbi:hypothetical protein AX774_g361 [Zancudomyces culisetae]|uniref:Uncharacterized protein n=1 Tax=Zancudomyces culisetae TaxID=1213189 RepID=A0A1R1PYQ2_ZANCU|nr:hypothetical protein AX774_g361 [Zancudomyces culisetae]|eukprot:OMH86083.1 hypothetical protein AX774_g361 [Zancudomyces culisetae]
MKDSVPEDESTITAQKFEEELKLQANSVERIVDSLFGEDKFNESSDSEDENDKKLSNFTRPPRLGLGARFDYGSTKTGIYGLTRKELDLRNMLMRGSQDKNSNNLQEQLRSNKKKAQNTSKMEVTSIKNKEEEYVGESRYTEFVKKTNFTNTKHNSGTSVGLENTDPTVIGDSQIGVDKLHSNNETQKNQVDVHANKKKKQRFSSYLDEFLTSRKSKKKRK